MLNPQDIWSEINVVNVDFELDERQRATLSAYVKQEGFDIVQRLFIDVVRDFNTALMNTSVSDPKEVVAKHLAAKVAAQIYKAFWERLRSELEIAEFNARLTGTIDNPDVAPVSPDFL